MAKLRMEKEERPEEIKKALASTVAPVFKGDGDTDYGCAWCGTVLLQGMGPGHEISGVVLHCANCGKYTLVSTAE